MSLDQPRLLHFEVLGGSFPLLPQQFLDFVGLVGFHESDLVFQHHVSSLDFFELPVDKMNDVMLGLVRLFDSLIL